MLISLLEELKANVEVMQMPDADFAEQVHAGTIVPEARIDALEAAQKAAYQLRDLLAGEENVGTIHHWATTIEGTKKHFVSFQFTGGNSNWQASYPEAMMIILQRERVQAVLEALKDKV